MFVEILFALSALLTLGSGVGILMTKNIMHNCIFLLGTLIGVAGLYLTLGADFVAVTQIMVYVGGIVILMLFAVMLTGGQDFMTYSNIRKHVVPAMGNKRTFVVAGLSTLVLGISVGSLLWKAFQLEAVEENYQFSSTVEKLGTLLITDYVLSFEIVSVLLLGAFIGAAIIARPLRTVIVKNNNDEKKKHNH